MLLANTMVSIDIDGSISSRGEFPASIKSPDYQPSQAVTEQSTVQVYGDTVVVVGIFRVKGTEKAKPYVRRGRFVDTWIKINGTWLCVVTTSTLITAKRLDEIYKLGAHPESFQLESSGPHIYVNLPDLKQVAVIDRTNGAIARWPLTVEHNFPMALDEVDHRLFIATHEPARLAVIDTDSGHMIAALPSVQDADDLYFDAGRKRIYMAGGEGFIYVFQQNNPHQYQLLSKIPTALGARTAGYFGKGKKNFERFFLAVPARADHGAEIWIYTVQD
jgi:hypothetical protein